MNWWREIIVEYKVKKLWSYKSYELITIIDQSNFQFHDLNSTLFIINRDSKYQRYLLIDGKDAENIINQYLAELVENNDESHNRIIELYNSINFYYSNNVSSHVEFLNDVDDEIAKRVKKVIRVYDLNKFSFIGNEKVQERIYKIETQYFAEYWLAKYSFNCNKLSVSKELLIKEEIKE